MAYEFMSLVEVEALPEVPENATVLAEVDGSIKRIPGNGLGSNNLVIVESSFTDTYTANMEFADALAAFRACELTNTVMYASDGNEALCLNCCVIDTEGCLVIHAFMGSNEYTTVYWNADGISTENPNYPEEN